jgi:hypothetical protein
MADLGLTPAVESKDQTGTFEGTELIPVDTEKLATQGNEWSKQYEEVVQEGEEVDTE